MAKSSRDKGEGIQIVISTLFMTAGGLLLITLALRFYFIPSVNERYERESSQYIQLTKKLGDKEMINLRDQARASAKVKNDQTLKEIIQSKLSAFALTYRNLPDPSRGRGRSGANQGTVEVRQSVDLEPAGMTPILQFVTSVLDAKTSVRVGSLKLSPNRRSQGRDSWTAGVEFIDYETSGGATPN